MSSPYSTRSATQRATGTFRVAFHPEPPYDTSDGVSLGRVSIDKEFTGELTGKSRVEMLSARPEVEGSAGYVAIERVRGELHGKRGSFVLQHNGVMDRTSEGQLSVTVVPDSGAGELKGLRGQMTITIVAGEHRYAFEYSLPA